VGDPYEILGVHPNVPQSDIRDAYRRKAKESHPDTGGDPVAFRAVQGAWEALGTPEARVRHNSEVERKRQAELEKLVTDAAYQGAFMASSLGQQMPARPQYFAPPAHHPSTAYKPTPPHQGPNTPGRPNVSYPYKIPAWFWFIFIPLALGSLTPGLQLFTIPAIAVLIALTLIIGRLRQPRVPRRQ